MIKVFNTGLSDPSKNEEIVTGYQEEPGSSFTHAGKKYDLNKVLTLTRDRAVTSFPIAELEWVLKFSKPESARVTASDPDVPVLIHRLDGKYVVVDGLHRLVKAKREGRPTIKGKVVYDRDLAASLI